MKEIVQHSKWTPCAYIFVDSNINHTDYMIQRKIETHRSRGHRGDPAKNVAMAANDSLSFPTLHSHKMKHRACRCSRHDKPRMFRDKKDILRASNLGKCLCESP
jgi:hypothetical protein